MTIRVTLMQEPLRAEVDVAIEAAPETSMTVLAPQLRAAIGATANATLHAASGPLALRTTLRRAEIRNGSVIGVGTPPPTAPIPENRVLAVISGPDAGAFTPLSMGSVTIGRDPSCDLVLTDPEASRHHAVVAVSGEGTTVADTDSTNGTQLRGATVTDQPVPFAPGATLSCGRNVLAIVDPGAHAVTTTAAAAGFWAVRRPPRLRLERGGETLHYPMEPHRVEHHVTPLLSVGLSAGLSVGLGVLWWWLTRESAGVSATGMLAFSLLSPILLLSQILTERWSRRRGNRAGARDHAMAIAEVERKVETACEAEGDRRHSRHPDPVTVTTVASLPTGRLWERRRSDSDWLELRLGLATQPAELTVMTPAPDGARSNGSLAEHPLLSPVPVVVNLGIVETLGIAGPHRYRLLRWMVAQLAVFHSPHDLQLAAVTTEATGFWRELRWLPHVREFGIAAGESGKTTLLAALVATRRGEPPAPNDGTRPKSGPAVVVISEVDPVAEAAATICLADDSHRLPESCRAVIATTADGAAELRIDGQPPICGITTDLVTAAWLDRIERSLAPLQHAHPTKVGVQLPSRVGIMEVLDRSGIRVHPQQRTVTAYSKAIAQLWRASPRCTDVPIGLAAHGTAHVDLVADGPHALVAGTTGAGKSELLRTWLISLAVKNRPDELIFLLVDYKGGAAFDECRQLPHTRGLVTDLDPALTNRVLQSLGAELRRRERALAAAGVVDLSEYHALRDAADLAPLPRLLVVVDEFAALAAELPDLVSGLVDVARRGRSLGIHVILATQRPAGVVSAEIRANTPLRICLRVADAEDSLDVLAEPAAMAIDAGTPGRAFVRQQGALREVHVASATMPVPETGDIETQPLVRALPTEWYLARDEPDPNPSARGSSQLALLTAAAQAAAVEVDAKPVPTPWLPPLPERLALTQLNGGAGSGAPFGLHDLPHEQRQSPFRIDLSNSEHLAVVGSPRYGRTTTLSALVAALAQHYPPDAVRIFGFDGSGELADLVKFPHCDALVQRGDADHACRLLDRLNEEISARSARPETPAQLGHPGLPWLVLLIDSWDVFCDDFQEVGHGMLLTKLSGVLRDGLAQGMRAAVTGSRSFLISPVSQLFRQKLLLQLADRDDCGLVGISASDVPSKMPPGRALVPGPPVTQVQLALLTESADPAAQRTAVRELAEAQRLAWPTVPTALRVRALPSRVSRAKLAPASEPWRLPIGVGGNASETIALDVSKNRVALIAGPPGSGKTTTLLSVAHAAIQQHRVILVGFAGNLAGSVPRATIAAPTAADLQDAATVTPSGLILVDDATRLADPALNDLLSALVSDQEHRLVLAGGIDELLVEFRGFAAQAKLARTGLLLAPRPTDGELLGLARLTASSTGRFERPGRGLLLQNGTATSLQVAEPSCG